MVFRYLLVIPMLGIVLYASIQVPCIYLSSKSFSGYHVNYGAVRF